MRSGCGRRCTSVTPSPGADGGTRGEFESLTVHHTLGSIIGRNGPLRARDPGPHVKLSSISVALVILSLCACATTSQPVVERLDPDTATTLTVINKPVELVGEGAPGPTGNPFAFIAPFETNRMGARALYLWMSAPSIQGANLQPQLICDSHVLTLSLLDSDISHIGLARAPYAPPVPWNMQWYFQLPKTSLDCLATAQSVSLETHGENGVPQRFTVEGKELIPLKEFGSH
jgi:hypothetical protein